MDYEELADLLADFVTKNGASLIERRDGPQAASIVEDLVDIVSDRLAQESPFSNLWQEFNANPAIGRAELIGALEMLEEADSEFALNLQGLMAEYNGVVGTRSSADDVERPQLAGIDADADIRATPSPEEARQGRFSDGAYIYGDIYNEQ